MLRTTHPRASRRAGPRRPGFIGRRVAFPSPISSLPQLVGRNCKPAEGSSRTFERTQHFVA